MKHIKLYEQYHEDISNKYREYSKTYTCSLEDINKGFCDEISYNVIKDVVGHDNYKSMSEELYDGLYIDEHIVYEIDDGIFWSDEYSEYSFKGDYWIIENLTRFGYPPFDLEHLNNFILKGHVWVYYDGKHYDAEVPNGVDNFWELPIYQRQLKSLGILD